MNNIAIFYKIYHNNHKKKNRGPLKRFPVIQIFPLAIVFFNGGCKPKEPAKYTTKKDVSSTGQFRVTERESERQKTICVQQCN